MTETLTKLLTVVFCALSVTDPTGEIILPWVQPDSTNPYAKGDKVTHNNQTWMSSIDNNAWEPGVYGWEIVIE